jgi:hypothetical protein
MSTVVIERRRSGDLDSYVPSSQKAALAFDVDDVTGRDGNSARSQFQNLTSCCVLYRNHPDFRPAHRTNNRIQTDTGNYSREGVEQFGQLQKVRNRW